MRRYLRARENSAFQGQYCASEIEFRFILGTMLPDSMETPTEVERFSTVSGERYQLWFDQGARISIVYSNDPSAPRFELWEYFGEPQCHGDLQQLLHSAAASLAQRRH